jgi:hypothetical protein
MRSRANKDTFSFYYPAFQGHRGTGNREIDILHDLLLLGNCRVLWGAHR